ncbi:hypothetical protein B0T17DRAFT_541194 [Bombardia bombarda]|uniref:FluG domain-containing protein n=1 Tax=Bombardia bombarda TaxID=252184 RepID=A0AA39WGT7_9PEZI|nr:hypothetical protein B0T17DRAFT_541194 [Bombardia bombarda]
MAPVLARRPLHQDIVHALQDAAKKRHRDSQVRKEEEKWKVNSIGYQAMRERLNETSFIPPLDADNTRANIYYIKKKFMRFCRENSYGSWEAAISARCCDKGLIMSFLHWICETYLKPKRKRSKKKTVNQYWRDFKMLYRRANKGDVVNANDCEEIVKYINGILKAKFRLDDLPKTKPVMGVDDLLLGLTHHWSRDRSVFPTEDDRLDLPTIMLFQAYTACRPAELVDGTRSRGREDPLTEKDEELSLSGHQKCMVREQIIEDDDDGDDSNYNSDNDDHTVFDSDDGYDSDVTDATKDSQNELQAQPLQTPAGLETGPTRLHKALCYEDLTLWIVKDPKKSGRDVLAMEVYLRYHKGADNKPKPTVFLFREHPLPILCPISHILARALRDDAIQVDGYDSAEPFFATKLGKDAVKVHWKPCKLKTPVFRKSVRTTSGGWEKSPVDPMKYATYAFYLDRIGKSFGSEEKWTSYCMRRGNANAIIGLAPDAVVDQVMRHDPMTGCLANAYLNHRVGFNVQDAYLERDPSADGLTRAFTHMSIRCNPEVPKEIPKLELDELPADPDIVELSRRVKRMSIAIRQEFKFIRLSPKRVRRKYSELRRELRNAEKNFRDDMTKIYQDVWRRRLYDEELERQLSGVVVEREVEPTLEHHLQERNRLQKILCDFKQELSLDDITRRKVRAINLMVALASQREVRPANSTLADGTEELLDASEASHSKSLAIEKRENIPLVLERTQCIYCVGDERLSYKDRTRKFSRVSYMMDHVEKVHLRRQPARATWVCHHPKCKPLGDFLTSLDHFKNHVQKVHGVKLRK